MATRKTKGTASVSRSAASVKKTAKKTVVKKTAVVAKKSSASKASALKGKTASKPVVKKVVSKTTLKTSVKKSSPSKSVSSKTASKQVVKKSVASSATKKSVGKSVTSKLSAASKTSSKTLPKTPVKKVVEKSVVSTSKIDKKNIKKDLAKNNFSNIIAQQKSPQKKSMTSISVAARTTSDTSVKNVVSSPEKGNKVLNEKTKDVKQGKMLYAVVSPESVRDISHKNDDGFKSVITPSQNELPQEVVDPGFLSNDDVFDETDHAQWQQLREQAAIHERAMNLNKPESHPDFNGKECIECGEVIPVARLQLKKVRCVDCQNDLEEQSKRNHRHTPTRPRSDSSGWDDA